MMYDYIVVGAGSAGSVLAARLSEDPAVSVLLLEAGPRDTDPWIHLPIGVSKTIRNKAVNWLYATAPDAATSDRAIPLPRGKVLGGSSSINGHVVTRGQPEDYDAWAAEGNAGWDFAGMLPYFRKLENAVGFDGPARGHGGPMNVMASAGLEELSARLVEAAGQCGIPYNPDPNNATSATEVEGIARAQRAMRRGLRVSAAKAYLKPARGRRNLTVETGAHADRIVMNGRRATGVDYVVGGERRRALAGREVLLCGGAIGSPGLLERSGIGQAGRLRDLGIEVVLDAAGVGENLHDHFLARGAWELTRPISYNEHSRGLPLARQVLKYLFTREGLLATGIAHMILFTRSSPEVDRADLEITISPFTATRRTDFKSLDKTPGVFLACVPLRPRSRGQVHITAVDACVTPDIRPNYLHDVHDQQVTVAGLRRIRALLGSAAFDDCRGDELWPPSGKQSDADLLQYARDTGLTIHHPVGTCRMGPAGQGFNVVSADLTVHGIGGLRVVDASVMPSIISGHTNFPTVAIAEKAAAMIRAAA